MQFFQTDNMYDVLHKILQWYYSSNKYIVKHYGNMYATLVEIFVSQKFSEWFN